MIEFTTEDPYGPLFDRIEAAVTALIASFDIWAKVLVARGA